MHVHFDGDDREYVETMMDAVAKLVYGEFPDGNPIISGHVNDCEESDHCCGPGSNYLRDHDAPIRALIKRWESRLPHYSGAFYPEASAHDNALDTAYEACADDLREVLS